MENLTLFEQPEEIRIRIPLRTKGTYYVIGPDGVRKLCRDYQMIPSQVINELRKLAAWNENNPKKRKTQKGIRKHIGYWFGSVAEKSNRNNRRSEPVNYSGGFFS